MFLWGDLGDRCFAGQDGRYRTVDNPMLSGNRSQYIVYNAYGTERRAVILGKLHEICEETNMNLKESYRYANFLNDLLNQSYALLENPNVVTTIEQRHFRSRAVKEAEKKPAAAGRFRCRRSTALHGWYYPYNTR